ncbi:hypothetical protein CWS43_18400 [Rahnella sp. AA]|nr:hypothetical protein CWS43_18400 [Rahnella sp. AA]
MGSPPKLAFKFKFKFKVKVVGVGPHRLGGRHIAATPQDPPGSFTARYRSLAMFQQLLLVPQNPAASRFPSVGLQTARKDTRFSTSPCGAMFESGHRLIVRNLAMPFII